ncbi:ATP-binding cassette domain-containing protein [Thalassotalea euphylliae]|uniref:ATP-binding cassette domain-containing protein n=1 Tax=Thalassotalea euphylliae TaxID=1655234 RepID=A0A3E0TPM6_9GAMM|nr:ATP-binding cassette domain-containing protein [Thalassotalea euphylliae]REL26571.1 ATP-binding cassette domain-containing protein [Thalassotalea euphylliae]
MKLESDIILKVSDLAKSVTLENHILDLLSDINLAVSAGETLAIVGASGSGKTTLLSLLAGLDLPSSGRIELMGNTLHTMDEEARSAVRAKHVGFIFQQFLLVNSLTALENVMLPAELANMPNAEQRAKTLLAQVDLAERVNHFPSQMSGGEQQRVAIARAFITQPDILFADEPTGNLDSKTGLHITELLFDLNKQNGTTLILVTHDEKLAERCHRKVIVDSGRIIADKPTESAQDAIASVDNLTTQANNSSDENTIKRTVNE